MKPLAESSPSPSTNARSAAMRDAAGALTHSLELVAAMVIGVWLGWQAQRLWPAIAPWGLVGGAILGMAAVMRSMWRMITEADHRAQQARAEREPRG